MIVKYVVIGLLAVSAIGSPVYFSMRSSRIEAAVNDDHRPPNSSHSCGELKQLRFELDSRIQNLEASQARSYNMWDAEQLKEYQREMVSTQGNLIDC